MSGDWKRISAVPVALAAMLLAFQSPHEHQIARAQADPAPPRPRAVDPRRVDDAIRNGVEFLKTSDSPPWAFGINNTDELILLTLSHAGVPEENPRFKELLA